MRLALVLPLLVSLACSGGGTGTTDSGDNDGGTSDGGTSDGGTSDGGTSDGGTSDGGTSDGGGDTGPTTDGPADHVWIFVFDGVRTTESCTGSADPKADDPALADFLAHSAWVPLLENKDATTTEPAHRTMVTGRRQPMSNFPWYEGREYQRALSPTIFEAVAAELATPGSVITGNTVFMDSQGSSLYPGHAGTGHALEVATQDMSQGTDDYVMTHLAEVLDGEADDDGVRLALVNLHDADRSAHNNRWEAYGIDIDEAVALVQDFQATRPPGNDTYILLADHGRHLDPEWRNHGDGCAGCRASWVIAWGHGIAVDAEPITQVYELADVAPTVAHLLGVDLPTARGRVISELLADPPPPRERALVDPDLATGSGVLHMVAQQLPGSEGDNARGALLYRRSTDRGKTWTESWFAQSDSSHDTPEAPQVLAVDDVVVRLWRAYSPDALNWQLLGQASQDAGITWSTAQVIAQAVNHVALPGAGLDPATGRVLAIQSNQDDASTDQPSAFLRIDGFVDTAPVTWNEQAATVVVQTDSRRLHMPTEIAGSFGLGGRWVGSFAAIDGDDYEPDNENREIFVAVMQDADGLVTLHQATDDDDVSYWPSLLQSGSGGWLAWASLPRTEDGRWQVRLASSGNLSTWTEPLVVETERAAWRPSLVATRDGPVMAWVEIDGPEHSIWVADVLGVPGDPGLSLSEPTRIAVADGAVDGVSLATASDGSVFAAWHEASAGGVAELGFVRVK